MFKQSEPPAVQAVEETAVLKTFNQVPGPKGFPIVGTLFDYFKKAGLSFDKMFEVGRLYFYRPFLASQFEIGTR